MPYPSMINLDGKIIHADLKDEMFACDVAKCKGACCVEGDLGAPLEDDELQVLEDIFEQVKPYMRKPGLKAIEDQGLYVLDFTNHYSTPLVNGRECAYVNFTSDGIALCAIEQAYEAGDIDFKKPISCHLYPVRISHTKMGEALNYDRWSICSAACSKGEADGTRVYEFVKDALIRKYGEAFYEELHALVQDLWPPE